jgi:hypothetical protein
MLSRKTFATNSLVQNFLQDVWFGRDNKYSNIKSTPNYSYSSIDAPSENILTNYEAQHHQLGHGVIFVKIHSVQIYRSD